MLATAVLNSKGTVPDVSDSLRMLVTVGRRISSVLLRSLVGVSDQVRKSWEQSEG